MFEIISKKSDLNRTESNSEAIIIENVSKRFKIPKEKRTTLRENIIGLTQGKQTYDEFWALRNVSFSVKKGETLGIIGENGSGKSTLLKLIAGVLYPNDGRIEINGKIAPFLELGVGFNGNLTAKDNVYLYGSILGMSKKEMDEKYDGIIDFAEIKQFENMKVKNYSSGMYARLAFATAVATEPDILLLDEVLAVGDEKFQMKCREKIKNYKKSGATIVLVSHSLDAIQSMCDRAILFEHGKLIADGNVWEMGAKYRQDMGIKHMKSPKIISPLENEIFESLDIILTWDINNSPYLVDGISLGIRDITDDEDGKVYVFQLPKDKNSFNILEEGKSSNQNLVISYEKKYRCVVRAESSLPATYIDSDWSGARIFSISKEN